MFRHSLLCNQIIVTAVLVGGFVLIQTAKKIARLHHPVSLQSARPSTHSHLRGTGPVGCLNSWQTQRIVRRQPAPPPARPPEAISCSRVSRSTMLTVGEGLADGNFCERSRHFLGFQLISQSSATLLAWTAGAPGSTSLTWKRWTPCGFCRNRLTGNPFIERKKSVPSKADGN